MKRSIAMAITGMAILFGCCGAAAATPMTLGQTGGDTSSAVDASGNAYVAWYDAATSTDDQGQIAVCEIPAGGTSCANLHDLA